MRSRKPWRILVSRKTVAFIFELNNSIYGSKSEPCANGANSLCRVMSVLVKSKFGDPTNDKNTVLRLCVTTDNDFFLRLRLLIFIRFSWVGHLASFSKQVTVHFILCISHSYRLYKEELLFSYFSAIRCFAVKLLPDFLWIGFRKKPNDFFMKWLYHHISLFTRGVWGGWNRRLWGDLSLKSKYLVHKIALQLLIKVSRK